MDRERLQKCLEVVAAYRASGQKSKLWAQANGVPERVLASWCAHSRRWQARLVGVSATPPTQPKPKGFVATRLASTAVPATVHIQVSAAQVRHFLNVSD